MSACGLLYARLNAQVLSVGGRISPDLRRAGDALPCIVYELQQDVLMEVLGSPVPRMSVAHMRVHCLADTLIAADALADSVFTALHAVGWTSGGSTAHIAVVRGRSGGVLEDDRPDGLDLAREIILDLDLTHS